uniref:NIDO domain-containing protein n=1 Tax=Leptobrachium leishanense TaxID=445787 RepID=A0A8C5WEH6_9ANUR
MYPYDPEHDAETPTSDDGSSPQISFPSPLAVFGNFYPHIYVNNNGFLSFDRPMSDFTPRAFPLQSGGPILAPFWADVDNEITGSIYYHQSTDPHLLERATFDVRSYFNYPRFTAQWAFVATWDNVTYYGAVSNEVGLIIHHIYIEAFTELDTDWCRLSLFQVVNTFQAVLITDWTFTFVLFNYENIQWTTDSASEGVDGLGGNHAQAGLNSGNSSFYSIPGSLSQEILHVSTTSNVYFSGRWAFKVDGYDPEFPDFPPTDGSLSCTQCVNTMGSSCTGSAVTCPSGSLCGSQYAEYTDNGVLYPMISRSCIEESRCNTSTSFSFAESKVEIASSCCDTDLCTPEIPELPSESSAPNGVTCPTCRSPGSVVCYSGDTIQCTGKETTCFLMNSQAPDTHQYLAIRGCAIPNVCDTDYQSLASHFGNINVNFFCAREGKKRCETFPMLCNQLKSALARKH